MVVISKDYYQRHEMVKIGRQDASPLGASIPVNHE